MTTGICANPLPHWVNPKTVAEMYDEFDLSTCPLFTGGFINFGYWSLDQDSNAYITEANRLESEKNLYLKVAQSLSLSNADSVLEVGCGLGLGASMIVEQFKPEVYCGVDASKQQIMKSESLNESMIEAGNLSFKQGLAENLPFESNQFSKVLSVEAAQHFTSFSPFCNESFRVLKPGGRLVVSTFFGSEGDSLARVIPMIKTFEEGIDQLHNIEMVKNQLIEAGFVNIRVESIGKNVWPYFDQWISQTDHKETWDRNWLKAYESGILDYYIVIADKPC
ncbi:MAG: class I SAM-dependent methyltransferase [Simkaniaceae bacterium]|nr:class I SAM-dependent methyltransferase [Simkaniaceae bacterium]